MENTEPKFVADGPGVSMSTDDGKRKVSVFRGKDNSYVILFIKDGKEISIRMSEWAAQCVVINLIHLVGKPCSEDEKFIA